MNDTNLSKVDLNLLVVFDALMSERHATRAGQKIGLTQPAVSHALNRLRHMFGDPLFVRSPQGMTPTPAAQRIAPAVRSVLTRIQDVLRGSPLFDPSTSTRQFTLGLSDYAALVLLPRLTARLEREAPNVTIVARNTAHAIGFGMLESGDVELIAGNFPSPPPHLREELLYLETFACAVRSGHPALRSLSDPARYLKLRHLQVSTRGNPHGYVDDILIKGGRARQISLTVSQFLMAPMLIATSDLVATEPHRLFDPYIDPFQLRLFKPPFAIPPFRVVQAWHGRNDTDAGHLWLRQRVKEISQTPAPISVDGNSSSRRGRRS